MSDTGLAGIDLVLEQFVDADASGGPLVGEVVLTFEQRSRSRLRTALADGVEAAIVLPRGHILRDGQRLASRDGREVRVTAANESVTTARAGDAHALARACYHLGNRHLALQIGDGWVRYLRDHVIDELAEHLGLAIVHEDQPFEPEDGAYRGGHSHGHGHGHSHGHNHAHAHAHDHDH